ncbi:MAG: hypothetical protein DMG39_21580 [Acidobacteria bacterium]|nr:MAG: hypothetical protein DMG39_21580 [Acidobacteriota bacterium]
MGFFIFGQERFESELADKSCGEMFGTNESRSSGKPRPGNDKFVLFFAARKTSKANGEKVERQSLEGKLGTKIH